jgi:hypothetical protein
MKRNEEDQEKYKEEIMKIRTELGMVVHTYNSST